ncbi:MAG: DUF4339 domain-containing protein, partial [Thermoguttaceae bacterium]|nr:DUF4339 domain-containing protein [Thermoguttaceae bacterium]
MSGGSGQWYLVEAGGQAQGPFTTEKVLQLWRSGQVRPSTLCWREGQINWMPLSLVEPFATTIRQEQAKLRRKVIFRLLGGLLVGVGLALAGLLGWRYWADSTTVTKFREMIAEGKLEEAEAGLREFRENSLFCRSEAEYLLASALLRMYAQGTLQEPPQSEQSPFTEAKGLLQKLAESSARWQYRIRTELVNLLADIPRPKPEELAKTEAKAELAKAETLTELFRQMELSEPDWPDWLKKEKEFAQLLTEAQVALQKQSDQSYQTALRRLEEALAIKPNHAETQQRLQETKNTLANRHFQEAQRLCSIGEFTKAQKELQEVFSYVPEHPNAKDLQNNLEAVCRLVEEAQQAEKKEDYKTAFSSWTKALENFSDNSFLKDRAEKARVKAGLPEPHSPKEPLPDKPEVPPPPDSKPAEPPKEELVIPSSPETLQDKLRKHRKILASSTQVAAAVKDPQTKIIELTDTCTYSQFDAQQAQLLRDWVRNGGVLWVNNDVLNGVFGIRYSRIIYFPVMSSQNCVPAGGDHPILKGVREVYLEDLRNKSFT